MHIDFMLEVFRQNADKACIIYRERTYTYQQLLEIYHTWIAYLQDKGVPENAVVALKSDFNPSSIGLLLALIYKSSIIVPISPAVKNPDSFISIAQAEYCIEIVDDKATFIKNNVKVDHELLQRLKHDKHPGLILFSSGTTGKPKGTVHDMVPLLNKFIHPGKTFKTITFLLFDHIGGFNTLMHILSNGGTIVTIQDRSPEEVCRLIEKYEIELLPTSPTFINMILFSRAYERYDISCLEMVSYGTEPMPETTLQHFHRLFPDIQLKQTYGLSEIGIMRTKSENNHSLWLKVGGEDYATKIVDGKLWIKAKTAILGYLNAPSPFLEDGWLNTGDRVEVKGDYIRFIGRESEIINVGGEKVYPIEVESILLEIEGVKDAAVHGEKHPLLGNIVVADIYVDSENSNKAFELKIKKYCQAHLEKFKVPMKINFTQETLSGARFKKIR